MAISVSTSRALGLSLLAAVLTCACRDSDESSSAPSFLPSTHGANGCRGPDQIFTPPQSPTSIALTTLSIISTSRITAAAGGELLYATGANGTVVAIDVSGPTPVEEVIVAAGVVDGILGPAGISDPAQLGAIAVLDFERLLVVELASHTVLSVERLPPHAVAFYAGLPDTDPGFADGLATGAQGVARFGFDANSALCPTAGQPDSVLVADSGNHAIRWIHSVGSGLGVETLCGTGAPGDADGALNEALFDTPSGLSLACNGTAIVSERGGNGFGNRIRQVEIGPPNFLGGFLGGVTTMVGDGTDATISGGLDTAAVSQPVSPLVSSGGEIYWIDAGTGVLRRRTLDGIADCPLLVGCTSSFPRDHAFSLTCSDAGILYVLDATGGVFYRVTP